MEQPTIKVLNQITVDQIEVYNIGNRPTQKLCSRNRKHPEILKKRSRITDAPNNVIALQHMHLGSNQVVPHKNPHVPLE
jgi:hypothetical protein